MLEAIVEGASKLAESAKTAFDPSKKIDSADCVKEDGEVEKQKYNPDLKIFKEIFKEEGDNEEKRELTQEEKDKIKEETGWSDEIIDAIGSMEEYEIYKKAGLKEAEICGRKCLINPNIDMEQKDAMGRTNKERMEQGLAPLDKNGNPIELHHIGQKKDGPLAELTQEQHRSKENYSILHDTQKDSEIDRTEFNKEKQEHWKERAKEEGEK